MSHTRTLPSMEELSSQRASWLMTSPVTRSLCPLKHRTILVASTSYLHRPLSSLTKAASNCCASQTRHVAHTLAQLSPTRKRGTRE